MVRVYLAMYKGRQDGSGIKVWAARLIDWAIRTITRSPYSHCEIAIRYSGGLFDCYSSSARDGLLLISPHNRTARPPDCRFCPCSTPPPLLLCG